MGTRKNKFEIQRNCANTGKIFIISFISPGLSNVSFEVQHFRSLVMVEMISLRRYISQSYRSLQYDVNNLGTTL